MKTRILIAALLGALLQVSSGDVPSIIHHQGVLLDEEGDPYNVALDFKFALVNDVGDTSYWSNDGTSVAGAEPVAALALPVSAGLFNVPLGDANLGMAPIAPSVFDNVNVYLRTWVGAKLLTPDRRITSVGFAMKAATVSDGAITPGSIPDNTIQSNHIVNNSVISEDLAPAITLESLNLEHNNALRTELSSNLGGRLRLWDGLDTMTAYLGTTVGGGDLNLFQINGKLGIQLNGDAATYSNGASAGGEVSVNNSAGNEGIFLDGQDNGGGRIEVFQTAGAGVSPYIDLRGNGNKGGAEVRVRGTGYVDGVEIFGTNDSTPVSNPSGAIGGAGGQINVYQPGGLGAILYGSADVGGGALSLRNAAGASKFVAYGGPYDAKLLMVKNSGVTSIQADAAYGNFGESRFVMRQDLGGAAGSVNTIQLDGGTNDVMAGGGRIRLRNAQNQVTVELDAYDADGNGLVRTQVLEITGGSDLSERFNINTPDLKPEPGMLVSIDPANPGELVLSDRAYDRTAAGVISGAGGVNPGMLMGQRGSIANGDYPVALTGRVYCFVDADHGAIIPGDLITTSPRPGHGMKVSDHGLAQGAIVGKAMTALEEGQGLVLVLVSLQ